MTVLVITLSNNDNENDSIVRVVKLVLLDFYNGNREKLSSWFIYLDFYFNIYRDNILRLKRVNFVIIFLRGRD